MFWDCEPGAALRFALGYRSAPLQGYGSGDLRSVGVPFDRLRTGGGGRLAQQRVAAYDEGVF
jgi:hypothetical protein